MQSFTFGPRVLAAALVAAFGLLASDAQAGGPFSPLAGRWIGGGILRMPGGSEERIRCLATYAVSRGGDALTQLLRCASASYLVDVRADVAEQGGELSGTWVEATRGASGSVSGEVRGPVIRATITGAGLTAALSVVTRRLTQSVSIRLAGPDLAGVSATFRRDR